MLLSTMLYAQEQKQSWHFRSSNSIGMILGEQGSKFSMNSVNGFQKKNWLMGLGLGIDPYGYPTIPIYVDIRKCFGKKGWKPFVYTNAGLSIPWINQDLPKAFPNGQPGFDLKRGTFFELGVGVKKKLVGTTDFFIQIGYSQKTYSFTENQYLYMPTIWQMGAFKPVRYDYTYQRLAVRMGITL